MKPTIGRIVIFHCNETQKSMMNNNQDIAPAVITTVWSDDCVNLKILMDGHQDIWMTSSTRGESAGQWSWPVINK